MIDPNSATWAIVREIAEKRVASARDRVMARDVDPRTADFERGAAAALEELLVAAERHGRPTQRAAGQTPVDKTLGY